jgi:S-DNA-T family DNA segregation ATPase FtsK/SpoIIIE
MNNEKAPIPIVRDFFGVLIIAFTAFALLSLTSYDPNDPSFNRHFSGKSMVRNNGGIVGAYLSDGMVQVFGSGAFFFPFVTLLGGWALIRGKQLQRWSFILGGGVLFLAGLCSMLSIQFPADPYFGKVAQAGGVFGTLLKRFLVMWLNKTGAVLFVSTLLFTSLLALTGIPVNTLIDGAMKLGNDFWQAALRAVANLKTRYAGWIEERKQARLRMAEEEKSRKKTEEKPLPAKEPVIVSQAVEPVIKKTVEPKPRKPKTEAAIFPVQEDFPFEQESGAYQVPPISLLEEPPEIEYSPELKEEILKNSTILERKLADFGIEGRVVQVLPGPVITMYEFEPAPGIKVSRILSLTDDLALAMKAPSVRIQAPVPGKAVVGIEIPNIKREIVYFKDIVADEVFASAKSKLVMAIGKDNVGKPYVQDLAQVPHLLVAGATGSGKSVGINAMICSILLNATPDEVKMIMVDPKMLELSIFDGIPHLIAPVVTNSKKAAAALQWAVVEMERRYQMMAEKGVRNISGFNHWSEKANKEYELELKKKEKEKKPARKQNSPVGLEEGGDNIEVEEKLPPPPAKLPYIVIVIDELADLMMVASKGVEEALARLAQMARAAGIHLIVATQRPSVDVLTGVIKANFPARIAYQVTTRVDSRTILDSMGAEKLLGKGDMLFLPPGTAKLQRIHGPMVSDEDISKIIKFIKAQKKPEYKEEVFALVPEEENSDDENTEDFDEKYDEAVEFVAKTGQASISMIQRRLRVGYNRAARMIEVMEREGVVGPSDGVRPREVFVKPISFEQ